MSFVELLRTSPATARAYRLVVLKKLTTREAAARLGVKRGVVGARVLQAKIKLGEHEPVHGHARDSFVRRSEGRLTTLGRCPRCSLLLPCVCLGSAADIAEMRTGDGAVYPESVA